LVTATARASVLVDDRTRRRSDGDHPGGGRASCAGHDAEVGRLDQPDAPVDTPRWDRRAGGDQGWGQGPDLNRADLAQGLDGEGCGRCDLLGISAGGQGRQRAARPVGSASYLIGSRPRTSTTRFGRWPESSQKTRLSTSSSRPTSGGRPGSVCWHSRPVRASCLPSARHSQRGCWLSAVCAPRWPPGLTALNCGPVESAGDRRSRAQHVGVGLLRDPACSVL
jgi:hypothetical protein